MESVAKTFIIRCPSFQRIVLSCECSPSDPPLAVGNSTLNYLSGTLGHSYMCRDQQTLTVTQGFSIHTYQLHVQPFGYNGEFGAGV